MIQTPILTQDLDPFLGGRSLPICYHDLLADPASHIDRIIAFLGLAVRPEQRQAAIALVEPDRKHH